MTAMRFATTAAVLILAAATFDAPDAVAGACPTCTSHDDCKVLDPGGLCVLWDRDFGCDALRQSCCPGQSCALDNGVPSCLGNGCQIVQASADASVLPDVSPGDLGGGMPLPTDAGGGDTGGTGATDAVVADTSTLSARRGPGGAVRQPTCECEATGGPAELGLGGWALIALVLVRRRR